MNRDYFYILLGLLGVSAVVFVFFFLEGLRGIYLVTKEQQSEIDEFTRNVRYNKFTCYGDYEFSDPKLQILQYPDFKIREGYIPEDLVAVASEYSNGKRQILLRADTKKQVEAFITAGRASGHQLAVNSGFRTFAQQKEMAMVPDLDGVDYPKTAIPGFSEHHLGTAVDISVSRAYGVQAVQAGYEWIATHAPAYGFIISYPKGKEELTGFRHEPWHLRYVGTQIAQQLVREDKLFPEFDKAFVLDSELNKLFPHAFTSKNFFIGLQKENELRYLIEKDFIDTEIASTHVKGILNKTLQGKSFVYPRIENETIMVSVQPTTVQNNNREYKNISANFIFKNQQFFIEFLYLEKIQSYLVFGYIADSFESETILSYLLTVCT